MDNINMQPAAVKKNLYIAAAIIICLAVLGAAGYFYWINFSKSSANNALDNAGDTAQDITDSATQGVLPSLQVNPFEDKPDVNPVDTVNPYKDIKTNPF